MGARAQVKIVSSDDAPVYLYTHWGSYNLPQVLASALDRGRGRWTDSEYLARIIFSEMIKDEVMGETGFGIGTSAHFDLDYPPIEVNLSAQTVTHGGMSGTFEEFIALARVRA